MNAHSVFIACCLLIYAPLSAIGQADFTVIISVLGNGLHNGSIAPDALTANQKNIATTFVTNLQSLCSVTKAQLITLALSCADSSTRLMINQKMGELLARYGTSDNMILHQAEIAAFDFGDPLLNSWKNYFFACGYLYSALDVYKIIFDPSDIYAIELKNRFPNIIDAATRIFVVFLPFTYLSGWEQIFDFTEEVFNETYDLCTQLLALLA